MEQPWQMLVELVLGMTFCVALITLHEFVCWRFFTEPVIYSKAAVARTIEKFPRLALDKLIYESKGGTPPTDEQKEAYLAHMKDVTRQVINQYVYRYEEMPANS